MKILMVLEREFPTDERVEKEAVSLIEAGHEVFLACYTIINRKEFEEYKGIKIYRKPISKFIYKSSVGCLMFPFYFNFWRNFLEKLFKNGTFDAIHIHDLPLVQVGLELKHKYKIPLVFDMHENYPAALETAAHTNTFQGNLFFSSKQWRDYEIRSLEQSDYCITVIEEMRDRISRLGISPEKIIIVPNTPDIDKLEVFNNECDKDKITLFYAGGLNIHRGLHVVIKGLGPVINKYPNIRFWIIGSGSYQRSLEALVQESGIEHVVQFLGWKNQQEMFRLLNKSDIALIPHLRSEQTDHSSPNKLYQYLYYGKPIISSDCNSVKRILKEAGGGVFYSSGSPESFSNALTLLIEKGKTERSIKTGKKLIIDKYNWDKTVTQLLQMYQSIQNQ